MLMRQLHQQITTMFLFSTLLICSHHYIPVQREWSCQFPDSNVFALLMYYESHSGGDFNPRIIDYLGLHRIPHLMILCTLLSKYQSHYISSHDRNVLIPPQPTEATTVDAVSQTANQILLGLVWAGLGHHLEP